ncbi:MAG: MFS family permease [Paracoccaceae bacterium]|jgi:MFS family permease
MTATTQSDSVPWREVLNKQYASPLLLVCLGVWLHAADGLIVATMMPDIIGDIGGEAYVAWSIALYEIGSIIAGASSAILVLKLGIRKPMIYAAGLFALGCIVSAAAPDMQFLLGGRLLQGFGGGGMTALAFIATVRLFPPRLNARVMAAISVLWGSSAFMGPMIGGFFTTYSTWRMGFVFFAVQAVFLALWIMFNARFTEPARAPDSNSSIPVRRLALLSLAVLLIAYAGIDVTPFRTPLLLVLGVGTLVCFVIFDARHPENRILPKRAFDLRSPVGAALLMIFAINVATMGLAAYGPLLLAVIYGTPPIVAGYILACVAIGWTISAFAVSGSPEHRDRYFIAAGLLLVFASVCGMIYSFENGPLALIAVFATIEGVGFGISWTFVLRRSRRLADPNDLERLSGAMPTVGRVGFAVGASITGVLANAAGFSLGGSVEGAKLVAATVFTGCLPFAFLALIAMVCFVSFRLPPPENHAA